MKLATRILNLNAKQSLIFKAANSIIFFIVLINLLYKIVGVKITLPFETFNFSDIDGIQKIFLGYFIAIILAPIMETLLIQRFLYFIIKVKFKLSSVILSFNQRYYLDCFIFPWDGFLCLLLSFLNWYTVIYMLRSKNPIRLTKLLSQSFIFMQLSTFVYFLSTCSCKFGFNCIYLNSYRQIHYHIAFCTHNRQNTIPVINRSLFINISGE